MTIYKPDATMIGKITLTDFQSVTNVAFGGADHKTLYITARATTKGSSSSHSTFPDAVLSPAAPARSEA